MAKMESPRDRTAVMTGAAQGSADAVARGLAAAGMEVTLADVLEAALDSVRADIPDSCCRSTADV